MVHADIADQDSILGQRLVDLECRALRVDRRGVVGKPGGDKLVPILAIGIDLLQPFLAGIGAFGEVDAAIQFGMNLPQEGTHIGHQAERHRIIAADFLRIDIDVNEFCRRNGEGIARDPRARGAIVESYADRQEHIGLTCRVIGLVMPGARDETERERMITVDGAKTASGCRHRNL